MWCDPPKDAELQKLLSDLTGKLVRVRALSGTQTRQLAGPVTVFLNPDKVPAAVSICDFEFAAFLGAVLTMVPPGSAKQSAASKKLPDAVGENYCEVMNVLSSKLTKAPNRVVIQLPYSLDTTVPENAKAIVAKPGKRVDFDVDVEGYGAGKVAFFLT